MVFSSNFEFRTFSLSSDETKDNMVNPVIIKQINVEIGKPRPACAHSVLLGYAQFVQTNN